MTITQQVNEDVKTAMRAKEPVKVGTLRMLKAAFITQEGKQPKPLTESEAIAIIRTEIKKRQDSIVSFTTGGRTDLADKELDEILVLKGYLPPELSEDELNKLVIDAIFEAGALTKKDMGKVMKIATAKANNAVDGKTLSQLVQKLLP